MKILDTANTKLAFNFDYKIAAVCIDLRRRFRNISCKWAVISSAFATDEYRQWSQTVAPRVSQSASATMIPSWKSHRVCFNCWRSSSMHALPRKFCNLLGWGPGCLVMATNLAGEMKSGVAWLKSSTVAGARLAWESASVHASHFIFSATNSYASNIQLPVNEQI